MAAKPKSNEAAKTLRANEKKWGRALIAAKWTLVPNQLLERQAVLGLDPTDVNILMHIMRHWWEADRLPFPAKATIARMMKVHPRTVQRRLARLEAAGFIQRRARYHETTKGRQSNAYDFSGLIRQLTPLAEEFLQQQAQRQQQDRDRLRPRGRARLRLIKNNDDK